MKFLHIADVHLGCTRYQLAESPRDFFDAWNDVITRYAVEEKVDFVLMCGDFFHKKNVEPETMNYAFAGLSYLRQNNIPVVTIEGNHDQKHKDSDHSWLRSLANWNLLYLLEPNVANDGKLSYSAWEEGKGGYLDIGNVRIFGSAWYGASANWAIPMLTEAIKANRRDGAFHILMLHTDVEGHQTHPIPALSINALKELRSAVEYVGLGHTHKHYEIENWAFNPGSIEITNISEFKETRGAFIVEIGNNNEVNAKHVTEYVHRPFQRITIDVTPHKTPADVTNEVALKVASQARNAEPDRPQPIIEILLRGQLGFPNSELEMQKMRENTLESTGALHIRVKNHSIPIEYAVAADVEPDISRETLERRVIEDLVIRDTRFRDRSDRLAEAVIGAKRMVMSDDEPEKIADFINLQIHN